jgi:hypothetical protein
VTEASFWKLVAGACCLPMAWALLSPDPPFYPHLQQFCFGTLASIGTARTVLSFPANLRRSHTRVAWAFSVCLLTLFLLEGLGLLALRYRAVLIPVALMAPVLSLYNRRNASA